MTREPAIRFVDPVTVQVGLAEWNLDRRDGRYAAVGYSRGNRVVVYGDTARKVVWDALGRVKRGELWLGAVVDIDEGIVVAQSLTAAQPGYVEQLESLVAKKRAWQKG